MERPLDRLFLESKQYLAPLQGNKLEANLEEDQSLLSAACAEPFLANLHFELNKAHPEAGAPYWRVRAWGLCCWQPLYLALICVYQLKQVPNTLVELRQTQQKNFVTGYALADGVWQTGHVNVLIKSAAIQLRSLFKALQIAHQKQFGGQPSLYQGLLADQLMESIIYAQSQRLIPATESLQNTYLLWSESLGLPLAAVKGLQIQPHQTFFARRSCCLHYRRKDGAFCSNCPRQHKAKKAQHV